MDAPMTLLDLHDAIAKAIADAIGHGMREKCERHAGAVLAIVGPQLLATAEHAERIKADEGAVTYAVARKAYAALETEGDAIECMRKALIAVWPTPPAQAAQVGSDELRVLRADARSALGMVELLKQARQRLDDVHGQLYCLRTLIDQCHAKGALLEYTDKVIKLTRYQTAADAPTALPVAQGEAVSLSDVDLLHIFSDEIGFEANDLQQVNAEDLLRISRAVLAAQPRAVPAERDPRGTFECPICGYDKPHEHAEDNQFPWHMQYREGFERIVRRKIRQVGGEFLFGGMRLNGHNQYLAYCGTPARQEGGWAELTRSGEYRNEWLQTLWSMFKDATLAATSPGESA